MAIISTPPPAAVSPADSIAQIPLTKEREFGQENLSGRELFLVAQRDPLKGKVHADSFKTALNGAIDSIHRDKELLEAIKAGQKPTPEQNVKILEIAESILKARKEFLGQVDTAIISTKDLPSGDRSKFERTDANSLNRYLLSFSRAEFTPLMKSVPLGGLNRISNMDSFINAAWDDPRLGLQAIDYHRLSADRSDAGPKKLREFTERLSEARLGEIQQTHELYLKPKQADEAPQIDAAPKKPLNNGGFF